MKKTLLTLALVLGMVQGTWAQQTKEITYISYSILNGELMSNHTAADALPLPAEVDKTTTLTTGCYYVEGSHTRGRLVISGDVRLVLCDGASLTCNRGVSLVYGNKLSIYGQDGGTGKLTANFTDASSWKYCAGIGSGVNRAMGQLSVHGGIIDATGTDYAAGIGNGGLDEDPSQDGVEESAGTMYVYAGTITARGGEKGAGIGGGTGYNNHAVPGLDYTQFGGTVNVTGGEYAAGLGGGGCKSGSIEVSIKQRGGSIGNTKIYGGTLTAQGGYRGAGIGSGSTGTYFSPYTNSAVEKEFDYHDWFDDVEDLYEAPHDMKVWGGTINATGGKYAAGIGGGCNAKGVALYVYGGDITATGGKDAAGIGGGEDGKGNYTRIESGTMRAYGSNNGAGIGGGDNANASCIFEYVGGTVIAKAGDNCNGGDAKGGCAIGGGKGASDKYDNMIGCIVLLNKKKMIKVKAGSSASSASLIVYAKQNDVFQWNNYVEVSECDHPEKFYTVNPDDKSHHFFNCKYCQYTENIAHNYDEHGYCYDCGYTSDGSDLKTVTVWRYDGKGWEKSSVMLKPGSSYVLPDAPADGIDFKGWSKMVNGPASYEMVDNEPTIEKGTSIQVDDNVTYWARYRQHYDAQWEWAEDHSSATVTITNKLDPSDTHTLTAKVTTNLDNADDVEYVATANYFEDSSHTYNFTDKVTLPKVDAISIKDNDDNDDILQDNEQNIVATVTLEGRTLYKDGSWNTLVLPFDLNSLTGTPLEGADIRTLQSSSFADGVLTLNFSEQSLTAVEAGKPYLVRWTTKGEDLVAPVFCNVLIKYVTNEVETDAACMFGSFNPMSLEANNQSMLFLGKDNTLYYPSADLTVGSCRAVFMLNLPAEAQGARIQMNFGEEVVTGINSLTPRSAEGRSQSENPSLRGEENGYYYSLDGRRMSTKPSVKSIYIHNGKKWWSSNARKAIPHPV